MGVGAMGSKTRWGSRCRPTPTSLYSQNKTNDFKKKVTMRHNPSAPEKSRRVQAHGQLPEPT